jgi:hypothetical protein
MLGEWTHFFGFAREISARRAKKPGLAVLDIQSHTKLKKSRDPLAGASSWHKNRNIKKR